MGTTNQLADNLLAKKKTRRMPLSSSLQADVCLNNKLEKKLDCRSQIPCEFVGRKVFFGIQKQMNESHKTKEMMCFCVCVCVCVYVCRSNQRGVVFKIFALCRLETDDQAFVCVCEKRKGRSKISKEPMLKSL